MFDPGHLSTGDMALRLGAGAVFGGVVGAEREVDGHDAGLRTHVLLALGSALFGLISIGAFNTFLTGRNATDVSFDPSRVASYVAAGVGFLGGGAILKGSERVKGLTTAASLWVVAAVGLAAGLGFWVGAAIASGMATATLVVERPIRKMAAKRHGPETEESGQGRAHSREGMGRDAGL